MRKTVLFTLAILPSFAWAASDSSYAPIDSFTYGQRPFYLVDDLDKGPLKDELMACSAQTPKRSDFSIAHRGAPLQFPEHTKEAYLAGARMGSGILECDVSFTKDHELVCRHSQNDLHTTTNILATPLAAQCSVPFTPAEFDQDGKMTKAAAAECRTSDITLAEFKSLKGKMDAANDRATTIEEYMNATPAWRTDLYAQNATLMTHKESIALFKELGVKMTPELKNPVVDMPFNGFTQEQYAQKLLDEYHEAGIPAEDVFPQSFEYGDVEYWLSKGKEYGKQAVFLDEELDDPSIRIKEMANMRKAGLEYLAPATPLLVTAKDGDITPSEYALAAKDAGFKLIAWSLERSGPLAGGGGWYYTNINEITEKDSDVLKLLDVLAQQIGVTAVFSDWPATVTYYANCKNL